MNINRLIALSIAVCCFLYSGSQGMDTQEKPELQDTILKQHKVVNNLKLKASEIKDDKKSEKNKLAANEKYQDAHYKLENLKKQYYKVTGEHYYIPYPILLNHEYTNEQAVKLADIETALISLSRGKAEAQRIFEECVADYKKTHMPSTYSKIAAKKDSASSALDSCREQINSYLKQYKEVSGNNHPNKDEILSGSYTNNFVIEGYY